MDLQPELVVRLYELGLLRVTSIEGSRIVYELTHLGRVLLSRSFEEQLKKERDG